MTSIGKGQWYYLAVKILLALLRGITSKNNGELFSFLQNKNKVELQKKVCEKKIFVKL